MSRWLITLGLSFTRTGRQARRSPALAFVFPMVPALAMVAVFAALLSRLSDLPSFPAPTYVDFLTAGAITVVPMTGAAFSGTALAVDIRDGYMDRIRLLPADPVAFLAGRAVYDSVRVMPAVAVVLVAAWALGAELNPGPGGWVGVVLIVALWTIAYNSLFLLAAAKTGSPEVIFALFPIFAPLTFLSSVWYPRSLMPGWIHRVSGLNPVTPITDGIRQLLADGYSLEPLLTAITTAAAAAVVLQLLTARVLLRELAAD